MNAKTGLVLSGGRPPARGLACPAQPPALLPKGIPYPPARIALPPIRPHRRITQLPSAQPCRPMPLHHFGPAPLPVGDCPPRPDHLGQSLPVSLSPWPFGHVAFLVFRMECRRLVQPDIEQLTQLDKTPPWPSSPHPCPSIPHPASTQLDKTPPCPFRPSSPLPKLFYDFFWLFAQQLYICVRYCTQQRTQTPIKIHTTI